MGLFANLPLPNPPVAQAGHPPLWGQRAVHHGIGSDLPCILTWVGEPHGDVYPVKVEILLGEAKILYDEAVFNEAAGFVVGLTFGGSHIAPSSPVTQPGHPPEVGQWSIYVNDDGTLLPCLIAFVGDKNPDGDMYNVAAKRIDQPRLMADGTVKPSGTTYGGWIYDVDEGRVIYDPCAPPWPLETNEAGEPDGDDA